MENQGYEEDRARSCSRSRSRSRARARAPRGYFEVADVPATNSTLDPDVHVYEDISSGREEVPADAGAGPGRDSSTDPTGGGDQGKRTESFPVGRAEEEEEEEEASAPLPDVFERTLTLPLPLRRIALRDGDHCLDRSNSSVRVTTREKRRNDRGGGVGDAPEGRRCFPMEKNAVVRNERPGRSARRRLKKDCKHCRGLDKSNDLETSTSLTSRAVGSPTFDPGRNLQILARGQDLLGLNLLRTPLPAISRVEKRSLDEQPASVFSISEGDYPGSDAKPRLPQEFGSDGDRAASSAEKTRGSMRINSIYSQDHCRGKEAPIFFTDLKASAFQRAFSLPARSQTVSSQNRVNLRRSVRGEPAPQPARLHKHRHGWTLHLAARTLDRDGPPGCTRTLILVLIVLLALLGLGAAALYIVFEPEQLQVIQQYLKSSSTSSSSSSSSSSTLLNSTERLEKVRLLPGMQNENLTDNLTMAVLSSSYVPAKFPEEATAETEVTTDNPTVNFTRYCDDCLSGEVCVGLVDEDVPTCRTGLDPQDPTGCAGLCLINKQRCHRLDVDAFRCVEVEHYCLDDEWTCLNTLCIPLDKRCDGHMNCYDHSDEYNCVCNPETHFQCGNETSCLPLERRCDGKIDCWDATDEINCTLGRNLGWSCPLESEFTCSNGQCILRARFCDGLVDCADESDEPHGCQGRCNKHEFTCQNSRCITKGMKCNGVDDCGDGTDELHCKDRST